MSTLVCLLEEPSAKVLLEGVLPRLVPEGVLVRYLVFEGKQDLERNVTRKLRAWRLPETQFVVLRDQDAGDCKIVKAKLAGLADSSGKPALVRVACHELEAWVAGDLNALAMAFLVPAVAKEANRAKFRDPDSLVRPVEEIRRLLPTYQKIDGARRMGPLLDPDSNNSVSFRAFCSGVRKLFPVPVVSQVDSG